MRKLNVFGGDNLAARAHELLEHVARNDDGGITAFGVSALLLFKQFCIAHVRKLACRDAEMRRELVRIHKKHRHPRESGDPEA